jgi:hypothetical protein
VYARIATFEGVDPAAIEHEAETIRSQMGQTPPEGLEDAQGVMMLLDRQNGKSLAIVLFGSEDGMRRGDEALNAMSPDAGAGRRSSVAFYEVPLDLRR